MPNMENEPKDSTMTEASPFGNLGGGTHVRFGVWNKTKRVEEIHEGQITAVLRHYQAKENDGYYIDGGRWRISPRDIKEVI